MESVQVLGHIIEINQHDGVGKTNTVRLELDDSAADAIKLFDKIRWATAANRQGHANLFAIIPKLPRPSAEEVDAEYRMQVILAQHNWADE